MVLSFVPEPTRRNIQHLKDYPVFKVFFFDFRTLAVSRSTRYASAQRAAHCDSRTACGIETFANLLSAMEALPEAFLAGKSRIFITELRLLHLWVHSSPVMLGC